MKRNIAVLVAIVASLTITACNQNHTSKSGSENKSEQKDKPNGSTEHSEDDGHDHKEGDGHKH